LEIDYCNFNNINILCYEQHTCEFITYNNRSFTDAEAGNQFKICSKKEINEILDPTKNKKDFLFTIIGGIAIILSITILIIFILIEKNKFQKDKYDDEFRSGNIYIKLNNSNNNNNNNSSNNNNSNTEINYSTGNNIKENSSNENTNNNYSNDQNNSSDNHSNVNNDNTNNSNNDLINNNLNQNTFSYNGKTMNGNNKLELNIYNAKVVNGDFEEIRNVNDNGNKEESNIYNATVIRES